MKKLLIIIVFMMSQAVNAQDTTFYRSMEYSYFGLHAMDLGLTLYALDNGAKELNPIMGQNPYRIAAIKTGLVVGSYFLFRKFRQEHPVAARWTLLGLNILYSSIVLNNSIVIINLNKGG